MNDFKLLKDYVKHARGSNRYGYVRQHARKVTSSRKQQCEKCTYDLHVETCHITPICDFDENEYIDVVNDPSNLILLCPNCHWEHDNLEKKKMAAEQKICKCGKSKNKYSIVCRKCADERRKIVTVRKVMNRPSREELLDLIKRLPMIQIGKLYNVSDNAIRKWCKSYDIDYKKNGGPCQHPS